MVEPNINLEKVRIRKIGVLSFANLTGVVSFFLGLLFGIIITALFFVAPLQGLSGIYLVIFGKFAVVFMPIAYGISGWISGLISGLFYNLGAKITKGIVLYA